MSHLLSVRGTLPEHRYPQSEVTEVFAEVLAPHKPNLPLLQRVHGNAGVEFRHLALPLERYPELKDFGASNDEFIRVAVDLGSEAVEEALAAAGLTVRDVDLVVSATITGLAVPSVEARIAARIGLRADVKRVPLVGLGCVAGAAGVARVHDYLLGHPGEVAVLVSTELCSLTVQRDDTSMANLVASGLFGDGAAAVVMVGADHGSASGPRVLATRSRMYADTERAMGWDVGASGLRIVLGVEVPDLVRENLREDVDGFLADQGLTRADIGWWVAHPGGPKVLEAMQEALEVDRDALGMTWDSLARIGNLSSASVLHVLADTLRDRPPAPGTHGLLLAMGPGFCLEMVLLHAPGA
ncbi:MULTISPECIES: type III polyketide synthase [unclassified Phycicoccus]|uniref:type III polyketide synthase n=1 Tax=unclassified Phycicoccus TaxID=2637926 RepID=UPI0007029486|nr:MULTISPECIES: 3-oxoacyl-[acyl-carrier-protein] synthase III C-terminal domain-containing protein [unclassified Phycicoccus]KQU68342.1 stilbene synthase [Phycicoccus sp. Root101]KQZ91109.1 stilbene synthase [Phycicoccus sp. Root563]